MSNAESWLILGGLFNLFVSILVAYALYWVRIHRPEIPAHKSALVSHKLILWNGFLLLGLAVAIEQTNFTDSVNTLLAASEVIVSLLTGGQTILSWAQNIPDEIAAGGWRARLIGIANMIHVLAISGILYGVVRNVLGI
ncbi:MAG TPA: hypothetical protein VI451_11640 [Anaerolineales bacterium]|nr:hypothetical protein [Anaerolineales bacterium]